MVAVTGPCQIFKFHIERELIVLPAPHIYGDHMIRCQKCDYYLNIKEDSHPWQAV